MDWADEIAMETVRREIGEGTYSVEIDMLAAALRKAKADGMREAADMMKDDSFVGYSDDGGYEFLEYKFEEHLRSRASQIEKGQ